jgi:membrane protein YdbS with pleckstrin-like domain
MLEPRYYHLGWRVYLLFFLRQGRWFILNVLLLALIIAIRIIVVLPDSITPLMVYQVTLGVLLLLPVTLLVGLIGATIQYLAFSYCLDEHSLKVKTGILDIHEDAIPYRQVQDINNRRNLLFRLLGISKLIILSGGTEDAGDANDESKNIIPAIDKHVAEYLQEELIKRANVARMVQHEEPV